MLKALARLFGRRAVERQAPAVGAPAADLAALLAASEQAVGQGRSDEAVARLEALLESYPEAAEAHVLLGTLLAKRRQTDDARDHFMLASAFRPDWWVPRFGMGTLELDAGNHREAVSLLTRAVELGADEARVHNALGAALFLCDEVSGAVEHYLKAIAIDPDFAQAHSNLGYTYMMNLERYEEGAEHIARAKALAPNDSAVLCNWSMVLHHYGRWDEALKLTEALVGHDPALAEARVNRALILLTRQDFARGWTDYEARKLSPRNKCASSLPYPEWDGSPLAGRTLFVYSEQGIGDQIMFASCLPELLARAARCVIECDAKLQGLFRRSFPDAIVTTKDAAPEVLARFGNAPDFKVAIGSLPFFFRRDRADFEKADGGYLRADPARIAHWKAELARLPGRLKVGISWRGGLPSSRRNLRSVDLERWAPVLAVPGIDFVSLQYSDPHRELERSARRFTLHHWPDAIDDYDETSALVCALDLVVSVQTAVVHLGGALGQRVWALIPALPEWRYGLEGASMPWYPTVRLFRQAGDGEWTPVLDAVAAELGALAAKP